MTRIRYDDGPGRYRIRGQTFEPGDDAVVSPPRARALCDDGPFIRVADAADAPLDPSDHTLEELATALADDDYDAAALDAIAAAEAVGDARDGAFDLLDDEREE